MIESLEIDPLDSDHWLYGTGLTVYGGHDLTKWDTVHNVSIASLADGIEEFSVQNVASAPGGTELLAAVGDDNGFTFKSKSDLGTSPKTPWMTPMWTTSTDVGKFEMYAISRGLHSHDNLQIMPATRLQMSSV